MSVAIVWPLPIALSPATFATTLISGNSLSAASQPSTRSITAETAVPSIIATSPLPPICSAIYLHATTPALLLSTAA